MSTLVPIIDFRDYADDNKTLAPLAQSVDDALRQSGFMAVKNIGIDATLISDVFATSRAFFHASPEHKARSAYLSAAENFGYQGVGEENLDPNAPADLKETLTMRNIVKRPPAPERWPDAAFRRLMDDFYRAALDAAYRLQRVLAFALDTDADFFTRCHSGENVTLRLLHYPALPANAPTDGQLGAGAHTDYGLLTLLFQHGIGGLEVRAADGEWHAVDPAPDCIVINSGDLLERWTNGRYRSTEHRVQPMLAGQERQSIALFVDPDSNTEVAALPSCCSASDPPRYPPTSAGAHLQEKIEATHKARFTP